MTDATFEGRGCPTTTEPPAAADDVVDPAPFIRRMSDGMALAELLVRGARCAGCISKIEGGLTKLDAVRNARLNLSTGRLTVEFDDAKLAPIELSRTLSGLGYHAAPFDASEAEAETDAEGRRLLMSLAVAGFATANIMLLSVSVWSGGGEMSDTMRTMFHWISALIAIPAVGYAGRPFFSSAITALKAGRANMDVPITLAVLLATALSIYETFTFGEHAYFDAAVMLLFFLLIGRYLDHRLRGRARMAARELLALQARTASRIEADGSVVAVSARDVAPGDLLMLAPGDRVPVDVEVVEGGSDVDRSLATGESAPVSVGPGDTLQSGVVNLTARIKARATARADESFLAELARLIEAGEQAKTIHVRLADRAAALYVPLVHGLAFATFVGWLVFGAGVREASLNAIALLIVTCPCALGLAVPAVQVVATGRLFRRGILVKSGDALERIASVTHVVLDKTGTLTQGRLALANADALDPRAIEIAARLARGSRHPAARAVAEHAGPGALAEDVAETPGQGLVGMVDGRRASFGRRPDGAEAADDDAAPESWLQVEGEPPVRFVFDDVLRPDAVAVLRGLKERGLGVEMLTGDRAPPARALAAALGIEIWRAEATPQDKAARLDELTRAGERVLMVGDGLNDAPALARAHASMSPGAAAEASQHAADLVFQGESLGAVIEAIDTAKAARGRILENFGFAALYNAIAVPLAAAGFVTPLIAAIAMSSSSIVVTLNALRLELDARANEKRAAADAARFQAAEARG